MPNWHVLTPNTAFICLGTTQVTGNKTIRRTDLWGRNSVHLFYRWGNWGIERLTCPRAHKARMWTQRPLTLEQLITLFSDCLSQKEHEGQQKIHTLPPIKLPGQWKRGGFGKGIGYQKTFWAFFRNFLPTKADDMIPIGSKTTNPKDQMTVIPHGSEAAKTWAEWGGLGGKNRAVLDSAYSYTKDGERILFHIGRVIVIREFHSGLFSNHIFIWHQK